MLQQMKSRQAIRDTLYIHSYFFCETKKWHVKTKLFLQVAPDLDEDLPLELVGWGQPICCDIHRLGQQHVSKHLLKVSGHIPLLHDTTVVLDGQNDGIAARGPQIRTWVAKSQKFPLYLCFCVWFSCFYFSHSHTHNCVTAVCPQFLLWHFHVFIFVISLPLMAAKRNRVTRTHAHSLRCDEGMLFDGGQDITKLDFCREGVSMVDDWHSVWTIPAVHWK